MLGAVSCHPPTDPCSAAPLPVVFWPSDLLTTAGLRVSAIVAWCINGFETGMERRLVAFL